jgi:formyl-CoA transferase
MERLGIGYEQLSAANPRLIYASITAYGTKGPYADKAGFDRLVQGLSGAMFRKDAQGRPMTTGVWIADWAAPMLTAYGISLALLERERTGAGQRVDSSRLHAAIAMQFGEMTVVEDDPAGSREENPSGYNSYLCADGVYLNVAAFFQEQHARLCNALDLPHLADDPRFTDPGRRGEIYQETGPIFAAIFATEPSQHWIDLLNEADVPVAPIVPRAEVPYTEQVIANDMVVPVEHPVVGRTRITGTPVHLSKNPSVPLKAAPVLGEHTEAILTELGYTPDRIAGLQQAEVI